MPNIVFASVVIPVLHEAAVINECLDRLRALPAPGPVEIIVVDGDPDGDTIAAVSRTDIVLLRSKTGRAHQMNAGAAAAQGAILLFLHADTQLPHDAFGRIGEALEDSRYAAGAFDLGIDSRRRIFRITEVYAALRTRVTRIPFGDQAIFVRKAYFDGIRGYAPLPLMEDVELMGRIKRRGDRICIIPEKITTSARRWEKEGILYATVRNWMLQILYCAGVPPEKMAHFYR